METEVLGVKPPIIAVALKNLDIKMEDFGRSDRINQDNRVWST